MTKQKTLDALTIFVSRLVEEKNFQNLDPEVLEQIKSDLLVRVEEKINIVTLKHLPPKKLEEFNRLLDTENMDEIQSFCHANIPDFENVIAETLLNFRSVYLNS